MRVEWEMMSAGYNGFCHFWVMAELSNYDIGLLFASLIQGRQLRVHGGRPWNLLWQAWMLGYLCTLRRFLLPWNPTAHCKRSWSLRTMTFQELFLRAAFIHQKSSRHLRQCQQGQICIPSCWEHSRAHPQTLLALCKVQLAISCSHSRPMSRSWRRKLEVLVRIVIFLPYLSQACSSSLESHLQIQNSSTWSWEVGSPMEKHPQQWLLSRVRSLLIKSVCCKTTM